jgi:hypothetical protein
VTVQAASTIRKWARKLITAQAPKAVRRSSVSCGGWPDGGEPAKAGANAVSPV